MTMRPLLTGFGVVLCCAAAVLWAIGLAALFTRQIPGGTGMLAASAGCLVGGILILRKGR